MSKVLKIMGLGFFLVESLVLGSVLLINVLPSWNEEFVNMLVVGMVFLSFNLVAGLMVFSSKEQ